jgi:Dolichyl-phosphate-mannose-protein mannosyltransferase
VRQATSADLEQFPKGPDAGGTLLQIVARPVSRPLAIAWTAPRWLLRERTSALVLVVAVAALLRLPFPDLTPFGHDEALEAERARPIWYGARPIESEITSWWIPDPAGLLYLYSLAEPFPQPAVARVLLVALMNVMSVALCYLLARRFFGPGVGLTAGLLYAANPWAVTFGRQPWVITQPLLTTLMLFAAMMVVVRRDRRWIVPFFVAGAAQTQTHLLAVLYALPMLLTLVLFARRWLAWQLVPAVLVGFAIVTPYVLHLWGMRDAIAEAMTRGNRGLTLLPDGTAVTLTNWLISGYNLEWKLGVADVWMDRLAVPLLLAAVIASVLLLVGTLVSAGSCLRRQPGWEADALLLIWLLGPLALMSWQTSQVYIHYVLCLVPVPFVVMARGAVWLASAGAPLHVGAATKRTAAALLVGAVLLVQVAAIVAFYAALDRMASAPATETSATEWQHAMNRTDLRARQLGIGELHGLPLRYWQTVADQTRHAARSTGIRSVTVVSGILDDGNRHLDRRRKALNYLLGPDLEPRFPLEGLVVVPTARDTVVLTLPDQELPRIVQRAATRLAEAPQPGTSGAARLFQVKARPVNDVITLRRRTNVPVADGVRLVVLDLPPQVRPGQTVPLAAYLLIEDSSRIADQARVPYVELVDSNRGIRTSTRRGGLESDQWRSGDLLIQQLNLTAPVDLPEGDYELRFGLVPAGIDDLSAAVDTPTVQAATLRVRTTP